MNLFSTPLHGDIPGTGTTEVGRSDVQRSEHHEQKSGAAASTMS